MIKDVFLPALLVSLTRHLTGALGALGVAGDTIETQAAGTVALAAAVGWSLLDRLKARREARKAAKATTAANQGAAKP